MSTERISGQDYSLSPFDGSVPSVVESGLPSNISIANIDSLGYVPDLYRVLDAIHHEPKTLLQPSLESLENSFRRGKAVVLMDGDDALGYVRFSPLLDPEKKERLGLPENFPDIDETGTAIIVPDHRGNKYYPKMRTELIKMAVDDIRERRLFVLGTTKNPRVIESLDDAVDKTGIEFEIVNRHEIPMIAPFTCVCEGDFGNGFQNGTECHQAPTDLQLVQIETHELWKNRIREDENGKIPCTIYVSSLDLAREMERELMDRFGSQEALIDALLANGHYE